MLAQQLHKQLPVVVMHTLFQLRRECVERGPLTDLQLVVCEEDARRVTLRHRSDVKSLALIA